NGQGAENVNDLLAWKTMRLDMLWHVRKRGGGMIVQLQSGAGVDHREGAGLARFGGGFHHYLSIIIVERQRGNLRAIIVLQIIGHPARAIGRRMKERCVSN